MRVGLRRFLFGSLRRQLILGVALVHALMMALFVWDLVERQKDMLLDRQVQQASALAYSVATSSAGWLASRDYFGLQEIITAQTRYPDLAFAMLLDTGGQVLAHTDIRRLRQQVTDLPEQVEFTLLAHSATLVDVVTPVMLSGIHIGWVRIGLGQATTELRLKDLVRDGVLYALAAILIGSLIAGVMGSRLARRVTALRADMEAFQAGETARRARVEGADEASELARGFNFMLDVLGQREQQLHESMAALAISEERWLLALDGAGHGVWDWDVVRDRLFLSPRWRAARCFPGTRPAAPCVWSAP